MAPALGVKSVKDLITLAQAQPERTFSVPPAIVEVLPGYARHDPNGMPAPARTPRPILNQIGKEVASVLALPDVKERLQAIGFVPAPTTPEEYDKILRDQIETLSKVAKDAGLRAQ